MPRHKKFQKEEVLEKAMNLFWENGYHQTSIQNLVDTLKINRASLYDTFGGKKELFHLSIEKYLKGNPEEGFLNFILSHESIKTGIKSLIQCLIDDSEQDDKIKGCFLTNSSLEMLPHDSHTGFLIKKNQKDIEDALRKSLIIGQDKGEFKANTAIEHLPPMLFALMNGIRVTAKLDFQPEQLRQSLNTILDPL